MLEQLWQVQPIVEIPEDFIAEIRRHFPDISGKYAAQLLWQRNIRDINQLAGFLNSELYKPASAFEFGEEMYLAVNRLQTAINTGEKVAIWGDFDADGVTATSVLWDGLGQFFSQYHQLIYYIPDRLTESHGLNCPGIDNLAAKGFSLIVTCDTGSTNLKEIEYANQLGIDIIVTDHHTLPLQRPPVVAIINPRYLSEDHQLFNLSGVAVAYKLIEALYYSLPDIPKEPLENLLDLVAIGLIADLVKLTGDCRYLAQIGLKKLQENLQEKNPYKRRRPGVGKLLELCQRNGDRPTDISFGIGPRINAVSRIHGDASFCVELLTSRDLKHTEKLALETELANTRRKSLQKYITEQVKNQLVQLDLSTTGVIVLENSQWQIGVLGLVASQIAQEYGRPTILLSTETDSNLVNSVNTTDNNKPLMARGSARSFGEIDLYQLVFSQSHLLDRFGGHPFAAGLSLPVENIPVFTESINRQLRQQISIDLNNLFTSIQADIVCTVAELGEELFRELKCLEPFGMGNPTPKILIQNCWFDKCWHDKKNKKGEKVQYIKTDFVIKDNSTTNTFPGIWWGHYKEEIPQGKCDCVVELDYNTYTKRYEARLIAVKKVDSESKIGDINQQVNLIVDWRNITRESDSQKLSNNEIIIIRECPNSWNELQIHFRQAMHRKQAIAIAFTPPAKISPQETWQKLVGIAKYMSRSGKTVTRMQLLQKLGISDIPLHLGLQALKQFGFQISYIDRHFQISLSENQTNTGLKQQEKIEKFLAAVAEEQFRRQYFYQVNLSTIQAVANQTFAREFIAEIADIE